ncbi:MAG: CapA family protein [Bacillota bacterium]
MHTSLIPILIFFVFFIGSGFNPNAGLAVYAGTDSFEKTGLTGRLTCINTVKAAGSGLFMRQNREDEVISITVSAAGDCTLGTDYAFGYSGSFIEEADKNGSTYFFKNVKHIFSADDLTIVNLETTLTDADKSADKRFRFKGPPHYTDILKAGSIEAVNIANNHIYDYLNKGYEDTMENLKNAEIGFFGFEHKYTVDIKGIKVGCLGYTGWNDSKSLKECIEKDIEELRKCGAKLVIVSFHWGTEREYFPCDIQKNLGRHAVDSGADLVIGHHPHVIQGIESYNGKNIVYSLGNFCFGGNRNPSDKDTFIYQQTFDFNKGMLTDTQKTKIIPCSVSSVKTRNNYQPTPLKGEEAERVLEKLSRISSGIE